MTRLTEYEETIDMVTLLKEWKKRLRAQKFNKNLLPKNK